MSSPWDDDPMETAPFAPDTVITPETPFPTDTTTTTKDMRMNETNGSDVVTVTLKGGTGFDAPWIVIHGASVDHASTLLDQAKDVLLDKAADVAAAFRTANGGNAAAPAAAPAKQYTPRASTGSPSDKTCAHGAMVHRSGGGGDTGKRPWSGYFCPQPKGADQCQPVWG